MSPPHRGAGGGRWAGGVDRGRTLGPHPVGRNVPVGGRPRSGDARQPGVALRHRWPYRLGQQVLRLGGRPATLAPRWSSAATGRRARWIHFASFMRRRCVKNRPEDRGAGGIRTSGFPGRRRSPPTPWRPPPRRAGMPRSVPSRSGKRADFVVLSGPVPDPPDHSILDLAVDSTWLGGAMTYRGEAGR